MSFLLHFLCFVLQSIFVSSAAEQWHKGCDLGQALVGPLIQTHKLSENHKKVLFGLCQNFKLKLQCFFPSKLGEDQKHQSRHELYSQVSSSKSKMFSSATSIGVAIWGQEARTPQLKFHQ